MPILSQRHYQQEVINHSHDHHQVVIGLTGALDFAMQGQARCVQAAQLMFVPEHTVHACHSQAGSQCLVVDLPAGPWLSAQLGSDASSQLIEQLALQPQRQLTLAQSQLCQWLSQHAVAETAQAEHGTALLMAQLLNTPPLRQSLPLAELSQFIDQHLAEPLSVADLAKRCHLSPAQLNRRFLQELGLTPMQFVRQRRLQQAMLWLRHSRWPISLIASKLGYQSDSAFSAAVRAATGSTPSQLRQASQLSE